MTEERTCKICGVAQPLASFMLYHKKRRAWHCNKCHHKKYGGKLQEKRATPEGRAQRRIWNRSKVRTDVVKARERRHSTKRRLRYPEKEKAARAVKAAIQKGILVRPSVCSTCGTAPGANRRGVTLLQAHHHDYAKPLSVTWLCVLCHAAEHGALKREGDAP